MPGQQAACKSRITYRPEQLPQAVAEEAGELDLEQLLQPVAGEAGELDLEQLLEPVGGEAGELGARLRQAIAHQFQVLSAA